MLTRRKTKEWSSPEAVTEGKLRFGDWPALDKSTKSGAHQQKEEERKEALTNKERSLKVLTESPRGRQREPRRRERSDRFLDDSLRSPLGMKYPHFKRSGSESRRPRPTGRHGSSPVHPGTRKPLFTEKSIQDAKSRTSKPARPRLTDPHRLEMRQKQLDYGKNTLAYQNYIRLISKDQRGPEDPVTPEKSSGCSKRAFDGRLKIWRRKLHAWDPPKCSADENEEEFDPNTLAVTGWESLEEAMHKLDGGSSGEAKEKEKDILEEIDLDNYSFCTDWSEL
eukprot:m.309427 g.309427  ORF g.309427 m.309427 type:complete len:280 (+) comp46459_c0_seq1:128-967(+)